MALVLLSGGLDSCVSLFWAKTKFKDVSAICFNYGQSHILEIESAKKLADITKTNLEIVNIKDVLKSTSPLVNTETLLEEYESYDQMKLKIGTRVETTFVPFRNKLFLTIAANRAEMLGTYDLVTGIREADFTNFPDCREIYVKTEELSMCAGSDHKWQIHNPIIRMSRKETIEFSLGLPFCFYGFAFTHTSYAPVYPPLIQDYATVSREQGFRECNLADPLILRAYQGGHKDLPVIEEKRYQNAIKYHESSPLSYAYAVQESKCGSLERFKKEFEIS